MKNIEPIEGEDWRSVPGFAQYSVSNLGRFKRHGVGGEFELRGKRDRFGYVMIGLVRNKVQVWFLAHRVVACTFYDPQALESSPGQFLTVNHKNRKRDDNRLANLELVSVADNNRHWRHISLAQMHAGAM